MKARLASLVLSALVHAGLLAALAGLMPCVEERERGLVIHVLEPGPGARPRIEDGPRRPAPPAKPAVAPRKPRPPAPEPVQVPERAAGPPAAEHAPVIKGNPFKLSYEVLSETLGPLEVEEPGPPEVDGMLASYLHDLEGYKAVKYGKYDPGLLVLRDAMEDFWHPGFDQIQDSPLKGSFGKMLQSWQETAQTYGKSGSPVDDPPTNQYYGDVEPQDLGILDTYEQLEKSDAFTTRARLVVRLAFDGKGGWRLEKVQGSGHPTVDDAAVQAVGQALAANPELVPRTWTKTRWAFEADFTVLPPLPVAGFTFDLSLGVFETAYPLKKIVRRRIKLLAVETEGPGS
jgi:hypothetical protein